MGGLITRISFRWMTILFSVFGVLSVGCHAHREIVGKWEGMGGAVVLDFGPNESLTMNHVSEGADSMSFRIDENELYMIDSSGREDTVRIVSHTKNRLLLLFGINERELGLKLTKFLPKTEIIDTTDLRKYLIRGRFRIRSKFTWKLKKSEQNIEFLSDGNYFYPWLQKGIWNVVGFNGSTFLELNGFPEHQFLRVTSINRNRIAFETFSKDTRREFGVKMKIVNKDDPQKVASVRKSLIGKWQVNRLVNFPYPPMPMEPDSNFIKDPIYIFRDDSTLVRKHRYGVKSFDWRLNKSAETIILSVDGDISFMEFTFGEDGLLQLGIDDSYLSKEILKLRKID
ncbi:MAG: hypothetical protein JKX84_06660 [Flavobacteriales bacterium]|nr:hypothetical protein [Flavobacteriales bacterium]